MKNLIVNNGKVRWDFDSLKNYIESDSAVRLRQMTREKTNGNIKVTLVCECGKEFQCQLSSYHAGQKQCPSCSRGKRDSVRRKKWDEIIEYAKKKGNTIVSAPEEYENNKSKIKFKCADEGCEEIFECSWSSYLSTKRNSCKKCSNKKKMKPDKEVREELTQEGYTMISKEYLGNQKPLEVMCPRGHIYTTTFNQFQQGIRCKICRKLH